MAARLVIEIDGSQHGEPENRKRDDERTRWLEAEGYRIIRFWNNEVLSNIDGVLDTIQAALYGSRESEATLLKHKRRPQTR